MSVDMKKQWHSTAKAKLSELRKSSGMQLKTILKDPQTWSPVIINALDSVVNQFNTDNPQAQYQGRLNRDMVRLVLNQMIALTYVPPMDHKEKKEAETKFIREKEKAAKERAERIVVDLHAKEERERFLEPILSRAKGLDESVDSISVIAGERRFISSNEMVKAEELFHESRQIHSELAPFFNSHDEVCITLPKVERVIDVLANAFPLSTWGMPYFSEREKIMKEARAYEPQPSELNVRADGDVSKKRKQAGTGGDVAGYTRAYFNKQITSLRKRIHTGREKVTKHCDKLLHLMNRREVMKTGKKDAAIDTKVKKQHVRQKTEGISMQSLDELRQCRDAVEIELIDSVKKIQGLCMNYNVFSRQLAKAEGLQPIQAVIECQFATAEGELSVYRMEQDAGEWKDPSMLNSKSTAERKVLLSTWTMRTIFESLNAAGTYLRRSTTGGGNKDGAQNKINSESDSETNDNDGSSDGSSTDSSSDDDSKSDSDDD